MGDAGGITSGKPTTSNLFARSVDPIKKIAEVSFDAVTDGSTPLTTEDWLEAVFYPFIPLSITFNDPGLQEDGLLTNNVTLGGQIKTWDETSFSNFILEDSSGTIEDTSGTLVSPTGANQTVPWTATENILDTETLTIGMTVGGNGTSGTKSAQRQVKFYYPTYYHAGNSGLTVAQIKAGGTQDILDSKVSEHSYTVTNGHFYLAYPKYISGSQDTGFPPLTSVLNPLDYPVLSSMTLREGALTTDDSSSITYYIYEWTSVTTQTDFVLKFS